eukprot:COSAG06_NODE_2316_length_7094_cov_4.313796_4_plen_61_part_00
MLSLASAPKPVGWYVGRQYADSVALIGRGWGGGGGGGNATPREPLVHVPGLCVPLKLDLR